MSKPSFLGDCSEFFIPRPEVPRVGHGKAGALGARADVGQLQGGGVVRPGEAAGCDPRRAQGWEEAEPRDLGPSNFKKWQGFFLGLSSCNVPWSCCRRVKPPIESPEALGNFGISTGEFNMEMRDLNMGKPTSLVK